MQSQLRKLQHAAARGSLASAAEWAKISRAADKALALLLPEKGPRSRKSQMSTRVRTPSTSVKLRLSSVELTILTNAIMLKRLNTGSAMIFIVRGVK